MSGHSKWSKVKHQKAATDVVKSRAFTKASRGLTVSVREGGGITDPEKNFHLRLAIEQARSVNMPKDTIERAIEKGAGAGAQVFEQLIYEGYGPGGVAYLVKAATDNHQRTGAEMKHQFDRFGGSLATPGAVLYQFVQNGLMVIPKLSYTYDTVFEVYTQTILLSSVKKKLEDNGFVIDVTTLVYRSTVLMRPVDDIRQKNEELIESLETLEDVQKVFTTME
jgi:YebC/PmpR family DNA-binding regulatory protein